RESPRPEALPPRAERLVSLDGHHGALPPENGELRALRVYHRARRRSLAGAGAEEEARLGLVRRKAEGEVARDGHALEPRELQQRGDLGRGVEVALGVLDGPGLEELSHDVAA